MYERVLRRIWERVRSRSYVMTLHAEEEMEDDGLTILDVERVVLTGRIMERQRDRDTRHAKYVVAGRTEADERAEVVARLSASGKLVIVTVYRA